MKQGSKEIMMKILEITGFQGDREKFTNDFLSLCIQKTLPSLIDGLTYERQVELSKRINFMPPEKQEIIILEYIEQKTFDNLLLQETVKTLQDYLESVRPNLNPDQIQRLDAYVVSLTGTPQDQF